jgi:DNA mismatch endonuclease (patch repair protein)
MGGQGAKSNQHYWGPKIARNKARDEANATALRKSGWRVLEIWECDTLDQKRLSATLRKFLR